MDPLREEAPQHIRKDGRCDRIAEQDLCADRPIPERGVAWVARVSVDAFGDELVLVGFGEGDVVRKVGGGGDHC